MEYKDSARSYYSSTSLILIASISTSCCIVISISSSNSCPHSPLTASSLFSSCLPSFSSPRPNLSPSSLFSYLVVHVHYLHSHLVIHIHHCSHLCTSILLHPCLSQSPHLLYNFHHLLISLTFSTPVICFRATFLGVFFLDLRFAISAQAIPIKRCLGGMPPFHRQTASVPKSVYLRRFTCPLINAHQEEQVKSRFFFFEFYCGRSAT